MTDQVENPPTVVPLVEGGATDTGKDDVEFDAMTKIMRAAAQTKADSTTKSDAKPILKRPAGAGSSIGAKASTRGPGTIHYKAARIYTSTTKQGYRVMMPGENRIDVLFKWKNYASKDACMKEIKKVVDGKS